MRQPARSRSGDTLAAAGADPLVAGTMDAVFATLARYVDRIEELAG